MQTPSPPDEASAISLRRAGSASINGAPLQLTSFVGREREIAAVCDALATTRLLTLTGAGGSGKTRLAFEVVSRAAAATGQRTAWVELAPVRDPVMVPVAVLAALGVRDESRFSPVERLARILAEEDFLLVLDNC